MHERWRVANWVILWKSDLTQPLLHRFTISLFQPFALMILVFCQVEKSSKRNNIARKNGGNTQNYKTLALKDGPNFHSLFRLHVNLRKTNLHFHPRILHLIFSDPAFLLSGTILRYLQYVSLVRLFLFLQTFSKKLSFINELPLGNYLFIVKLY